MHFGTSNSIYIFMQKTKFAFYKQFLLGKESHRNIKKTHTDQSPLQFSDSFWKERTHKPLKIAAGKNIFSSVYVIDITCFGECFLFHVITGKHCFYKSFSLTWGLFQPSYCCVLWNNCFKRSSYFALQYLHNNTRNLIPRLQNKSVVH